MLEAAQVVLRLCLADESLEVARGHGENLIGIRVRLGVLAASTGRVVIQWCRDILKLSTTNSSTKSDLDKGSLFAFKVKLLACQGPGTR